MGVRMILSYQIISDWPVLINPELSPILILGFETIDRHGNKQACTFETSKPTLKILASFASSRFKASFRSGLVNHPASEHCAQYPDLLELLRIYRERILGQEDEIAALPHREAADLVFLESQPAA